MICPYLINVSLLLGAILSWGLMWPHIEAKKGDWYDASLVKTMHGLQGYQVFLVELSLLKKNHCAWKLTSVVFL